MEKKKEFPTAAALVMARSAKRIAGKYGDLGLARAARELQARALSAITMRQSYLPDDTSASAKLPAEQKPIPEKTVDRIRPPTASEAANMVDSAHERGLMEALEILQKRTLITDEPADGVRAPTPSEAENMVDLDQIQALRELAEEKGSSGHKSPASSHTAYPTGRALVMARAMRRVAEKHGDLGLARRARDLLKQAMQAIKKRQSVLSDDENGGV